MGARNEPFGRVYQRALAVIVGAGLGAPERLVYMTLVVRAGAGQAVSDGIPSLCRWTGLGERRVSAALKALGAIGVISRSGGGAPGGGWKWTTTITPIDRLPAAPDVPAPGAASSPESTHLVQPHAPERLHQATERLHQATGEAARPRGITKTRTQDSLQDDDVFEGSGRDVDAVLAILASTTGYPFTEAIDRPMLEEFVAQRPGVDLVADVERWIARAIAVPEGVKRPRQALRAWLAVAQDAQDAVIEPHVSTTPHVFTPDRVLDRLPPAERAGIRAREADRAAAVSA